MQHDSKLETGPLQGPLLIKKKATREQLSQINQEYVFIPKEFNKDTDKSGSGPLKSTSNHHQNK